MTSTYIIPTLEKQIILLGEAHESMTSASLKKVHKTRITKFEDVFANILSAFENFKNKVEKSHKDHNENKKI